MTRAAEKPATAEKLAAILRDAAASDQAVFPVGGGKAMGMGDPPAREGVERTLPPDERTW